MENNQSEKSDVFSVEDCYISMDFANSLDLPFIKEFPDVDCTVPFDDDCCIQVLIPYLEGLKVDTGLIKGCYSKDPRYWRNVLSWLYSMTLHFDELSVAKQEQNPGILSLFNRQIRTNLDSVSDERKIEISDCFHRACDILSFSFGPKYELESHSS